MSRFSCFLGLLALTVWTLGCSEPYELINDVDVDTDADADDDGDDDASDDDDDASDDDDDATDDDDGDDDSGDDDDSTDDDDSNAGDPSDFEQLCFEADEDFDEERAWVMVFDAGSWDYLDDDYVSDDTVCGDVDFEIGETVKVNAEYEVDGQDTWGVMNMDCDGVGLSGTFYLRNDDDEHEFEVGVDADLLDYSNECDGGGDLEIEIPSNP